jgi:hypothetical protein
MKRNLIALVALASAVTANAGWFGKEMEQAPAPAPKTYAIKKAEPQALAEPPEWFVQPPEDTPDMVFSSGYGESTNLRLAVDKCMTDAKTRLSNLMNSQIKSTTKSYLNDNSGSATESHEVTTQKYSESTIVGAQRVDTKLTQAGGTYQMFCLLRYPLAENNLLRKELERRQAKRESDLRSARAHQDMQAEGERRRLQSEADDRKLKEEIGPRPESKRSDPVSNPPAVKGGDTVSTSQGQLQLLDVDNEEYKQRRAEALKKPGAVVGQTSINTN